jgi:hypothetical protein
MDEFVMYYKKKKILMIFAQKIKPFFSFLLSIKIKDLVSVGISLICDHDRIFIE